MAILEVHNLSVIFPVRQPGLFKKPGQVRAVSDVSFSLDSGEILGVAGESGCGKSTLIRAISQLVTPSAGSVMFEDRELIGLKGEELRVARRHLQMVFQDPFGSLDPRYRISDIIAEPMLNFDLASGNEATKKAIELMEQVGLSKRMARRYPHELSGGQRQRVGVARALAAEPRVLLCDEPVSALDVSIQAQILNLLKELREQLDLAIIFISHDLSVVRYIADRVSVMYLGRIVETANSADLYADPQHPYTKALLNAVPLPDPEKERSREKNLLSGDPPSAMELRSGCDFASRCPLVTDKCRSDRPLLESRGKDSHRAACWERSDVGTPV
jgi:oligopeptide transport system ATP-binding protein